MVKKRSDWVFRVMAELRNKPCNYFVTLTYKNENLKRSQGMPVLCKDDIQKWLKRLRNNVSEPFRYIVVGEYGTDTDRPHYHCLLFGLNTGNELPQKLILRTWDLGHVSVGDVNIKSAKYVFKDMFESYLLSTRDKALFLMSRKPGIGANYVEMYKEYHQIHGPQKLRKESGEIPRYYKLKIFSKGQRSAYSLRNKIKNDSEDVKRREMLIQSGQSPGVYELETKRQYKERILNRNKNKGKL